jgi:hypothetical protein
MNKQDMVSSKRSTPKPAGHGPDDQGVEQTLGCGSRFRSGVVVVWLAFCLACGCSGQRPVSEPAVSRIHGVIRESNSYAPVDSVSITKEIGGVFYPKGLTSASGEYSILGDYGCHFSRS